MSSRFIPLSTPVIRGNEWRYVRECLDTAWVSSVGSYVDRFERQIADRIGRKHGIATVNGTAALQVALEVAGIGPGDEVLVPALTFVAPANAVRYRGAMPTFLDVDDDYLQLDPNEVERFLEDDCRHHDGALLNRHTGRRVRAILPVHLLGHPAPMNQLERIAAAFGLPIIEDAAESLGALDGDEPVGRRGLAACYSFNGNKIVTTGGGGMILTDDDELAQRCRYLTTQAKDDPIEYYHQEIGYNLRLTNLLAALGVAQVEQLDDYVALKRQIAARYDEALQDLDALRLMKEAPSARSTFWLYTIRLCGGRRSSGADRPSRRLLKALEAAGIQSRPLWHPLHRLPPFSDCFSGPIRVADQAHDEALSLPCSVDLSESDQARVTEVVRKLCQVL